MLPFRHNASIMHHNALQAGGSINTFGGPKEKSNLINAWMASCIIGHAASGLAPARACSPILSALQILRQAGAAGMQIAIIHLVRSMAAKPAECSPAWIPNPTPCLALDTS